MENNTQKTGLVLEGGGMRGLYTAGILDVFMEHGIRFDGVIGVSAGALHGSSLLSGQKGRGLRYNKKYCRDPRFMGIRSLIKTGDIVGADFCYRELPQELDIYDYDAFASCGVPFYVTCTDIETGKPVYRLITDLRKEMDWMRASASLPYVSRTVEIDGGKYLDGGCSDSIPVEAFRKMGYGRNVVILTRPSSATRKPEKKWAAKLIYHKYPEFVNALCTRHEHYNAEVKYISELESKGEVFVIRPDAVLDIGRLENDPDKIQRVYDLGVADGGRYIEKLKAWL